MRKREGRGRGHANVLQRCMFSECSTLFWNVITEDSAGSALYWISAKCVIEGSRYDDSYSMMCKMLFCVPPPPSARGQPGADPHLCSCTHSSQTHHSLRSEILQKFPWGNVRIHSISRWEFQINVCHCFFPLSGDTYGNECSLPVCLCISLPWDLNSNTYFLIMQMQRFNRHLFNANLWHYYFEAQAPVLSLN